MTLEHKKKLIEFNQLTIASNKAEIAFHKAKIAVLEWRLEEDEKRLNIILAKPVNYSS